MTDTPLETRLTDAASALDGKMFYDDDMDTRDLLREAAEELTRLRAQVPEPSRVAPGPPPEPWPEAPRPDLEKLMWEHIERERERERERGAARSRYLQALQPPATLYGRDVRSLFTATDMAEIERRIIAGFDSNTSSKTG